MLHAANTHLEGLQLRCVYGVQQVGVQRVARPAAALAGHVGYQVRDVVGLGGGVGLRGKVLFRKRAGPSWPYYFPTNLSGVYVLIIIPRRRTT